MLGYENVSHVKSFHVTLMFSSNLCAVLVHFISLGPWVFSSAAKESGFEFSYIMHYKICSWGLLERKGRAVPG